MRLQKRRRAQTENARLVSHWNLRTSGKGKWGLIRHFPPAMQSIIVKRNLRSCL